MSNSGRVQAILAVALILGTYGCGGPANEYDAIVTGTVTVDGELAKSGTVTFHPVKDELAAIGRIHKDGSYSLRTGQGDLRETDGGTVVPGEYLVTVSVTAPPTEGATVAEGGPPIPGPSLIDQRYAQKGTTDLRFTVKPGRQVIVLNLDRAEPTEDQESPDEVASGEPSADAPNTTPLTEAAGSDANSDGKVADEPSNVDAGEDSTDKTNPSATSAEIREEKDTQ